MKQDVHERGIASLLGELADGFSRLVSQHLALARLELAEDARALGKSAGTVVAGVPFVLVGYTLLMVALAALLRRWVGWAGGFAIVGGANLILGGAAIALALSRLSGRRMMEDTSKELQRTTTALAAAKAPPATVAPAPGRAVPLPSPQPPNAQERTHVR